VVKYMNSEVAFGTRPNERVLHELLDGYGTPNVVCDICGDTKVRDVLLRFDRIVAVMQFAYCMHCVDECGCYTKEKIDATK